MHTTTAKAYRRLETAAWLMTLMLLFSLAWHKVENADIGFHIAVGGDIWREKEIIRTNKLSFTLPDRPWVNYAWLSDVIFYLLDRMGGPPLLVVWRVILVFAIFGVLGRRFRKMPAPIVLTAMTLCMLGIYDRFMVRPDLTGLLFMAMQMSLLTSCRDPHWGMLIQFYAIELAWANIHPTFVIAPLLLGALCAGRVIENFFMKNKSLISWRWIMVVAISIVIPLINPYGWRLYEAIARDAGQSSITSGIYEWQPFAQHFIWGDSVKAYMVIVFLTAVSFFFAPVIPGRIILFAGLLTLSCRAQRHIGLFVIAAVFLGLAHLQHMKFLHGMHVPHHRPWLFPVLLMLVQVGVIIQIWSGRFALRNRLAWEQGMGLSSFLYPVKAVDRIQQYDPARRVFAGFTNGGYLLWRLYPDRKVFVDSRGFCYGDAFMATFRKLLKDPGCWNDLAQEYGIDLALISIFDVSMERFLPYLRMHEDWDVVYSDETSVLFAKRSNAASGEKILIFPASDAAFLKHPLVRLHRGHMLFLLHDYERARLEYGHALQGFPDFVQAHNNLAAIAHTIGNDALAVRHLREALRIRPDYGLAKSNLQSLLAMQGGAALGEQRETEH